MPYPLWDSGGLCQRGVCVTHSRHSGDGGPGIGISRCNTLYISKSFFKNMLNSLYCFSCIKLCGLGPLHGNCRVGLYKVVSEFLIGRLSVLSLSRARR